MKSRNKVFFEIMWTEIDCDMIKNKKKRKKNSWGCSGD